MTKTNNKRPPPKPAPPKPARRKQPAQPPPKVIIHRNAAPTPPPDPPDAVPSSEVWVGTGAMVATDVAQMALNATGVLSPLMTGVLALTAGGITTIAGYFADNGHVKAAGAGCALNGITSLIHLAGFYAAESHEQKQLEQQASQSAADQQSAGAPQKRFVIFDGGLASQV